MDRTLIPASGLGPSPTLESLARLAGNRLRAITFPGIAAPATVLLDRDGTVIVDRDYLRDPDRVALLPGALDGLGAFAARGIPLVIITNQSGVGKGRISADEFEAVNLKLTEQLGRARVALAGIYSCLHRDDEGCACRKPATGLVDRAVRELGLSLAGGAMVGDKPADLLLARRLGLTAFLVTTGYGAATLMDRSVQADYVVDSLAQVATICLSPAGRAAEAPLPQE